MNSIKLLWISTHAPFSASPHAGGQTLNYYYKVFSNDPSFEVKLLCVGETKYKEAIEEELANRDHECFYPDNGMKDKISKISNVGYFINPFHKYARTTSNYWGDHLYSLIKKTYDSGYRPNVIILEWTASVLMVHKIKKLFNVPVIASEVDVTFVGYGRKREYFKGLKGVYWSLLYKHEKKLEVEALKRCEMILPHNGDNIDLLLDEGIIADKMMWFVPYFHDMSNIKRIVPNNDILFFGAMSRPENYLSAIWFIENVFPLLKNTDLRFVIMGSNAPDELRKYQSDRIIITGFVEDIAPYFEQSLCFVAPLVLGAGIKVKVIEALSSGIPVLTNDIGIEGIPAVDGRDYYYCKGPADFAERILSIYHNPASASYLATNGRQIIEDKFDMDAMASKYVNMVKMLAETDRKVAE